LLTLLRGLGLPEREHLVARDVADNEHDARAAIGVGPFCERHWRIENVVHAVNCDRRRPGRLRKQRLPDRDYLTGPYRRAGGCAARASSWVHVTGCMMGADPNSRVANAAV